MSLMAHAYLALISFTVLAQTVHPKKRKKNLFFTNCFLILKTVSYQEMIFLPLRLLLMTS